MNVLDGAVVVVANCSVTVRSGMEKQGTVYVCRAFFRLNKARERLDQNPNRVSQNLETWSGGDVFPRSRRAPVRGRYTRSVADLLG